MELFKEDGHLTPEGYRAIAEGSLTQLESLEASEHLSFCDSCLIEYLKVVESGPLLAPEKPLQPSIIKRLKNNSKHILLAKYVKIASVACLVAVLWGTGFFNALVKSPGSNPTPSQQRPVATVLHDPPLNRQLNKTAGSIGDSLNGFFTNMFTSSKDQQDTAEKEETSRRVPTDENK